MKASDYSESVRTANSPPVCPGHLQAVNHLAQIADLATQVLNGPPAPVGRSGSRR
jgi:hypothetical protein